MNIYLAVFIGLVVVLVMNGLRSDLKLRIWRNPAYAKRGRFAASESVVLPLDRSDATEIVESAMKLIGARKVRSADDGEYVTGWIGRFISNVATQTEYQILVRLQHDADHVVLVCCARPRILRGLVGIVGADRSGPYVEQLIHEIKLLATQPPR